MSNQTQPRVHRHQCLDCNTTLECVRVILHVQRCNPCYRKAMDRILFGGA